MGELARRSGLSKQTLSKIEQGEGNPTVDTLAQLGAALDVSARRLLTEWGTPVFVQRLDAAEWTTHSGWSERVLDEVYGSGYVRNLVLKLTRGAPTALAMDAKSAGTLHHVYVIDGRVRTGPLSDPVELEPGDFVRFPGDVEHRHESLSAAATLHVVTTLPQLRQVAPAITRGDG